MVLAGDDPRRGVVMSLQVIKQAIADKKLLCPNCNKPVKSFDKFIEMTDSVWDGAGDSLLDTKGSKVTLICGNCDWRERTEFWKNYIED
jgi:transcription elongation factor Elf1